MDDEEEMVVVGKREALMITGSATGARLRQKSKLVLLPNIFSRLLFVYLVFTSMTGLQWQTPQVANVVDAAALSKNATLPEVSMKTAELASSYPPTPAPRPNYAPTQSSLLSALSGGSQAQPRSNATPASNHSSEDGSGFYGGSHPDSGENTLGRTSGIGSALPGSGSCVEGSGSRVDGSESRVEDSRGCATDRDSGHRVGDQDSGHHAAASSSNSVPTKKKKRSEMGPEERKLMRQAANDRASQLTSDIDNMLDEIDKLYKKVADDNNVGVHRVKELARHLPSIKPQKRASNYNVLLYFKTQQLNDGVAVGDKIHLRDLHTALKADDELMDALNDPDLMEEYRQQYDSEKSEETLKAIRVSKASAAKFVAGKINLLQQEADFMFEATRSQTLGFVARGSWDYTVHSCYYGTGPGDEFLRKNFNIGAQDMAIMWENHVCELEKRGNRKLTRNETDKELADLITSRLREITGLNNVLMSYATYEKTIIVPYKVNIVGWPEGVVMASPQKLSAANVRVVYEGWKAGAIRWERMSSLDHKAFVRALEEEDALNPTAKAKRSDAGGSHRKRKRDNGNEEVRAQTKNSKVKKSSEMKTSSKALAKTLVKKGSLKGGSVRASKKSGGARRKSSKFVVDTNEEEDDGNSNGEEEEEEEEEVSE
ncbi:hypothetical protein BDP27DRAFT_1422928 [Rhodocollybia butyracea]|uniref:Uncharacterized protein n=1 Tax=Rhodocollybia butyracea TaxID=206335 RepID=A0A9P5PSW9_9AGAR|nr:hypothetical protein BDP27DRAFT_1422928 [Rhodocollybia butyracea]